MTDKIIQIIAPSKPIFLVYKKESSAAPGIELRECSVVALVEEENGTQSVIGLSLGDFEYENPIDDANFLGYADSKEDAERRFGNG